MPCILLFFLHIIMIMERSERRNVFVRSWERGREAYAVLADNKYTTVAGTLVFFLVLSLVPLLFFLTLIFGGRISAEQLFELELFDWAKELIGYLDTHATEAGAGAGIFFLATTFWSGTGFFYHLRRSGEIICGITQGQRGWRLRLSAVLFALIAILMIALTGGVVIGANLLTRSYSVWFSRLAVYSVVTVFGFFGAWILNAYACPYRATPADMAAGSALTAVSWLIASVLFRVYLYFADPSKLYGALSALIVFLLFLYWIMICFTSGMIYNFRRIDREKRVLKRF